MKNSLEKFSKSNIYKTFSRSVIVSPIILFVFVISTVFLLGFLWYLRSGNKIRFNFGNMVFRAQYELEVFGNLKEDVSTIWTDYSLNILAYIVNMFTIESASLTALGALLVTIYINVRTEAKDYNSTSRARRAHIRAYRKFLFILIYLLSSIFYTHGLLLLIDPRRLVSVELKNISQPWIYFFFGTILVIVYNIFGKTFNFYKNKVYRYLIKYINLSKVPNKKLSQGVVKYIKLENVSKNKIRHDSYIKRFFSCLSGHMGVWQYILIVCVFTIINSLAQIFGTYKILKASFRRLSTPENADLIIDSNIFSVNAILYLFINSFLISLIYLFILLKLYRFSRIKCSRFSRIMFSWFLRIKCSWFSRIMFSWFLRIKCSRFSRIMLYLFLCVRSNIYYFILALIFVLLNTISAIGYGGGYLNLLESHTKMKHDDFPDDINSLYTHEYCTLPIICGIVFILFVYCIYAKKAMGITGVRSWALGNIFYATFVMQLLYVWNIAVSAYEDEMLFKEGDETKESVEDVYHELYERFKLIQNNIISDGKKSKDESLPLPSNLKLK